MTYQRLERFKKWARENLVGLSTIAISIAGIVTTVMLSTRAVVVKGAKATGKFAKALYNQGKKLGPLLAPLVNALATTISWGAKGLAWLSSNLCVLVLAFLRFIYEQYKQRKKENIHYNIPMSKTNKS